MLRIMLSGSALALVFLASAPAFAQAPSASAPAQASAPSAPAGPSAKSAPAAPAAAPEATLQEIVVTAQRRTETLQKAAIAATAVGGDQLLSRGVTDTDSLSKLVPALHIQPSGATNVAMYVRGVGSFGAGPTNQPAIAFAVDGVFIARPSGAVGNFYDLERVEVLQGPQGTLYGRNSTGGAVNLVTNKPKLGFTGGDAALELGNFGEVKGNGAVNYAIGDKFALRAAGEVEQRNGYLSTGYDDDVHQAGRLQLLYRPDDRLSVLLSGDYFHQGGKGPMSVIQPDRTVPSAPPLSARIGGSDPRSLALIQAGFPAQYPNLILPANDAYIDSTFSGVTATIDYDLGFAKLTSVSGYLKTDPSYLSYRPGFSNQQDEHNDQLSQEVRLTSPDMGKVRYVVGFYYFNQSQNAQTFNRQSVNNQSQIQYRIGTQSWAPFGQAWYSVTDRFRLVGGLRYTDEAQNENALSRSPTAANPTPAYAPINAKTDFSRLTWKAGVEFDATPRSLIYANVATGFKSGGVGQYSTTQPAANVFQPETLTAYTIGAKNRFFGNRLQANFEAFYWDYQNQQAVVLLPTLENPAVVGQKTLNIGKAQIYGLDSNFAVALTPQDLLTLDVQYLQTKYLSFKYNAVVPTPLGGPNSGCPSTQIQATPVREFSVDCSGFPAIQAPAWSLTGGYKHTFALTDDLELVASIDTQYQSRYYITTDYTAQEIQRPFTTSDAALTLQKTGGRLSLTAWIRNLEDSTIMNQAFPRTIQGTKTPTGASVVYYAGLRPPRTFGVRLGVKF